MIGNFGKIAPIIRIKNFPSRENVINDFKSFITERKYKENYKIIYKPNSIFFKVNNPSIAYKYNERFSNKIMANPLYQNSKCSLIFQKPKKDMNTLNISHNYSHIKPKLYLPKNSHTKNTFLNKSASVIGEYVPALSSSTSPMNAVPRMLTQVGQFPCSVRTHFFAESFPVRYDRPRHHFSAAGGPA